MKHLIQLVSVLSLLWLVAACAQATPTTPTVIREKETVTVIVKETVPVTVPVPVTVTPVPTPTPKRGGTLVIARVEEVSGLGDTLTADDVKSSFVGRMGSGGEWGQPLTIDIVTDGGTVSA